MSSLLPSLVPRLLLSGELRTSARGRLTLCLNFSLISHPPSPQRRTGSVDKVTQETTPPKKRKRSDVSSLAPSRGGGGGGGGGGKSEI